MIPTLDKFSKKKRSKSEVNFEATGNHPAS